MHGFELRRRISSQQAHQRAHAAGMVLNEPTDIINDPSNRKPAIAYAAVCGELTRGDDGAMSLGLPLLAAGTADFTLNGRCFQPKSLKMHLVLVKT